MLNDTPEYTAEPGELLIGSGEVRRFLERENQGAVGGGVRKMGPGGDGPQAPAEHAPPPTVAVGLLAAADAPLPTVAVGLPAAAADDAPPTEDVGLPAAADDAPPPTVAVGLPAAADDMLLHLKN